MRVCVCVCVCREAGQQLNAALEELMTADSGGGGGDDGLVYLRTAVRRVRETLAAPVHG